MAKTQITIAGVVSIVTIIIILYLRVYVFTEVAEVVIEDPKPFIDAAETLVDSTPKIIEVISIMCNTDELFINAIDDPMLRNVSDDTKEILLLLKNGTEINVCQAEILDEGLTAIQKHRINYKKLGCNIADCLN